MEELLRFVGLAPISAANPIMGMILLALLLLSIAIHVAFALGVRAHSVGRETLFVGSGFWSLATLLGGPLVALAYWIINASSLRPDGKQ
jgi:hypothetical protein